MASRAASAACTTARAIGISIAAFTITSQAVITTAGTNRPSIAGVVTAVKAAAAATNAVCERQSRKRVTNGTRPTQ